MSSKKACLVVNPRAGQNLARINDVIAVLAAAGWKTTLAIKEYGGQAMELATAAAEDGFDMVVALGGDGTLCQVINGVMNAKGQRSIVGLIPGGTINQWAKDIYIPTDPMKATLTLISSETHKLDVGHLEIEGLTFPETTSDGQQQASRGNAPTKHTKKVKARPKAKHHFLLLAGVGFDAAVIGSIPKPYKYRLGRLAFGIAGAQKLAEQQPFPVEIRTGGDAQDTSALWRGDALQVIVMNARRYADTVDVAPDAYIDDGLLDLCVITARDPLSTVQQITSMLVLHKPDEVASEFFRGPHFSLSVPASVGLQLDGSVAKLKDYLSMSDWEALQRAGDDEHVMVNYRFDSMHRVLRMAIPREYDQSLFQASAGRSVGQSSEQAEARDNITAPQDARQTERLQQETPHVPQASSELVTKLMEDGREVTVVGLAAHPDRQHTYIIGGSTPKRSTGENRPVAICVDDHTLLYKPSGEQAALATIEALKEGDGIVVEGKKSKRGVIRASRIVMPEEV